MKKLFRPKELFEGDVIAESGTTVYERIMTMPQATRFMNENVLREKIPRIPYFCNYDYVAQKLDVPDYAFRRLIFHHDQLVGPLQVPSVPELTVEVDSLNVFAQ